jgi:hypothetical protein
MNLYQNKSIVFFVLIYLLCHGCTPDQSPQSKNTSKKDTIIISDFEKRIQSAIPELQAIVSESKLKVDSVIKNEFRFYFLPPSFAGLNEYYKVNYKDSIITYYEFSRKSPDGSGKDSVYYSKQTSISKTDFHLLHQLIDNSMFWELESIPEENYYIDGNTYIFEAKRNIDKRIKNAKKYHYVYRHSPKNSDFILLAEFFRKMVKNK